MKLTFDEIYRQRKKNKNKDKNKIYFWLPNIRSVFNIGSVFRIADALNILGVFLSGFSAYPPNKDLSKSAVGAQENVSWWYMKNSIDVINKLRKNNIYIVCLEQTKKSISVFDFDPVFPLCIVVGNEITGIDDDILMHADFFIDLPMYGKKHSLNVAVSLGIASYVILHK